MNYTETFATNLRVERAKRKLTQAEVAEAVGITQAALCRYEDGTRTPTLPVLERFADYYETTLDYLVGREVVPSIN